MRRVNSKKRVTNFVQSSRVNGACIKTPYARRGEAGEEAYVYTTTSTQRLRNEADGVFRHALAALAAVEEGRVSSIKRTAISVGLRTGGRHHACGYRVAARGLRRLAADGGILHGAINRLAPDAGGRARPRLETGRIPHDDSDRIR